MGWNVKLQSVWTVGTSTKQHFKDKTQVYKQAISARTVSNLPCWWTILRTKPILRVTIKYKVKSPLKIEFRPVI